MGWGYPVADLHGPVLVGLAIEPRVPDHHVLFCVQRDPDPPAQGRGVVEEFLHVEREDLRELGGRPVRGDPRPEDLLQLVAIPDQGSGDVERTRRDR